MRSYPVAICAACGEKWGIRAPTHLATNWMDYCGICNTFKPCCSARDYGGLKEGWDE